LPLTEIAAFAAARAPPFHTAIPSVRRYLAINVVSASRTPGQSMRTMALEIRGGLLEY
jgi:hypothetical protein